MASITKSFPSVSFTDKFQWDEVSFVRCGASQSFLGFGGIC